MKKKRNILLRRGVWEHDGTKMTTTKVNVTDRTSTTFICGKTGTGPTQPKSEKNGVLTRSWMWRHQVLLQKRGNQ